MNLLQDQSQPSMPVTNGCQTRLPPINNNQNTEISSKNFVMFLPNDSQKKKIFQISDEDKIQYKISSATKTNFRCSANCSEKELKKSDEEEITVQSMRTPKQIKASKVLDKLTINKSFEELKDLCSEYEEGKKQPILVQQQHTKEENFSPFLSIELSSSLMELIQFPSSSKFQLLYQASRDGFSSKDFHTKCDRIPKTLTIVKSTSDCIFGGYTEQTWDGNDCKRDPNAFIFSLTNKLNKPALFKSTNGENAILTNSDYGPIFGKGFCILITNNANSNMYNSSNLWKSSYSTGMAYNSVEARSYLAGTFHFKVSDYAVLSNK